MTRQRETADPSLDDEDDENGISYLLDIGDFVVIDRVRRGKVTSGTFCYELEGRGVCFIMTKADCVTIPQRVRAQAHCGPRIFPGNWDKTASRGSTPVMALRRRKGTSR